MPEATELFQLAARPKTLKPDECREWLESDLPIILDLLMTGCHHGDESTRTALGTLCYDLEKMVVGCMEAITKNRRFRIAPNEPPGSDSYQSNSEEIARMVGLQRPLPTWGRVRGADNCASDSGGALVVYFQEGVAPALTTPILLTSEKNCR